MLYKTIRGEQNTPQLFGISLSRELSGLSFPEITKRHKITSYKTVASSNFRLKEKLGKNIKLKKQYAKIRKLCSLMDDPLSLKFQKDNKFDEYFH